MPESPSIDASVVTKTGYLSSSKFAKTGAKNDYRKSSIFGYKNGYALNADKSTGIGNSPLEVDSILNAKVLKDNSYDLAKLTYGVPKEPPKPLFKPQFVLLDGLVLSFKGYNVQNIEPPSVFTHRVRHVNINYYVVDDTISISEPTIKDAGYVQGVILKRSLVPNPKRPGKMYHFSDLNIGIELTMNFMTYRFCSCNSFTRTFMTKEGIVLPPNETMPDDPYMAARLHQLTLTSIGMKNSDDCDDVEHHKLKRFIKYDGKVLRFYAAWHVNESESEYEPPNWRNFLIAYYLKDDEVEINELKYGKNEVPSPSFLKKMKLPMNLKNIPSILSYVTLNDNVKNECRRFYKPTDFIIGNTICVMGRRFILYDCDQFTRDYFKTSLKIVQPDPINVMGSIKNENKKKIYPPHNGFGDPDDSLRNCISFRLQPPKSNFLNFMKNYNNILRYKMKMVPRAEEDEDRPFCMEYNLANNLMKINEGPSRGFIKKKFMSAFRLRKPGFPIEDNVFYGPKDFAIGAEIYVRGSVFNIVDLDEWTYDFMMKNEDIFTQDAIDGAKNHFISKGLLVDAQENRNKDLKTMPSSFSNGRTI
ncbi:Uncharacterised domain DM10,Domain of unknown function DUF1126 [Cinara cedri]|uniref:DM10 domain-containing protein n=1 Tax=Cinara cedri TaxID=506608 RepID=A0A5E4MJ69_9HEMI|nr:Uncharacterised domain DM10,Domain of unknown function DUF1126 [Cinara cedri]